MKRMMWGIFGILLFCGWASSASWAIPSFTTISGFIEDTSGSEPIPLQGTFDYEIIFRSGPIIREGVINPISPQVGDPITGSVLIEQGIFSIFFEPPDGALALNRIYFSLAIDTEQNGIDPADMFNNAFQVASVMFSQTGAATPFYTAHVGGTTFVGWSNLHGYPETGLYLAPFHTPSGGVRFNQISTKIKLGLGTVFNFGIYDDSGNLVVSSGAITITANPTPLNQVFTIQVPVGFLEPSALYYTALASSTGGSLTVGPIPVVDSGVGLVLNAFNPSAPALPTNFDPSNIVNIPDGRIPLVLPITFRFVEEEN